MVLVFFHVSSAAAQLRRWWTEPGCLVSRRRCEAHDMNRQRDGPERQGIEQQKAKVFDPFVDRQPNNRRPKRLDAMRFEGVGGRNLRDRLPDRPKKKQTGRYVHSSQNDSCSWYFHNFPILKRRMAKRPQDIATNNLWFSCHKQM